MASQKKKAVASTSDEHMPLWAKLMIEHFETYSASIQSVFTEVRDRVKAIEETQDRILARLASIESRLGSTDGTSPMDKSVVYSTFVKFKADSKEIDEKARRIAWIGIGEQESEELTRRFDREILKEAVQTSGNDELIREFEKGRITSYRHPAGKPRGTGARGRIIKISLPNQELRNALLSHMRAGRQSLTRQFVHSFARRDYTSEELRLDRRLRKEAGERNAAEGKLMYIVRDFDIVKLKTPRELVVHRERSSSEGSATELSSEVRHGDNLSMLSQSRFRPTSSRA
ncbi:unnamed protein product [Nippostrongylus brasiliensis]|uniref:LINE-1 type transposase domain-containing protein 1 n=1 Tax=Nippostrongylus brasiliensis TaxID=27835 RepID=A0A0N4XLY5_NIPBR|nr:unnamed protein product [Nippostrongylus brasiliensis]